MSNRPLVPCNGNDRIYTPSFLAKLIIDHFKPTGKILEPCRGKGAFSELMVGCDWCEIDEGRDFLKVDEHWDWIVTNPPWSKFRLFLNKSMQVADNIVFLCLVNALFMRARQRDMIKNKFGIVEIFCVPVPEKPWPQVGFLLGGCFLKRNYKGSIRFDTTLFV